MLDGFTHGDLQILINASCEVEKVPCVCGCALNDATWAKMQTGEISIF